MTKERVGFANEEQVEEDAKAQLNRRGVKLQNRHPSTRQQVRQDFEAAADEVVAAQQSQKERAQSLVVQYWALVQDTNLDMNKGPIQKSVETDTIKGLVELAEELNSDETKPEGYGAVALLSLLLKTTLHLRNENNKLAYQVALLEKRLVTSNVK